MVGCTCTLFLYYSMISFAIHTVGRVSCTVVLQKVYIYYVKLHVHVYIYIYLAIDWGLHGDLVERSAS